MAISKNIKKKARRSTRESEEDQKKEAAKEQAEKEQAEIDATSNDDSEEGDSDSDDFDPAVAFDPENDFEQAAGDDSDAFGLGDDNSEDSEDSEDSADDSDDDFDGFGNFDDADSEDDSEDSEEDSEDSEDSEDFENKYEPGEDEPSGEDESEFKIEITDPDQKLLDAVSGLCKKFGSKISIKITGVDPEGEDEEGSCSVTIECADQETLDAVKKEEAVKTDANDEEDGEEGEDEGEEGEDEGEEDGKKLDESLQYEPNTVGAVVKLLNKSDPRDFLFIRLAPNMKQCMIYDIDRSVMVDGQSTTYLEIALGKPS